MKEQTNTQIVIQMLEAKNSMEKAHDFASNTMRKAREKNPITKFRVLQLHHEIQNLKETKGEARKSAAVSLAKSLVVPHKSVSSVSCDRCGTPLKPGAAFCGNCGAKV